MLPSVAPAWFAGGPQAPSLPYSLFPMNLGMWPLSNGAAAAQPVMPQATQTTVMTAAGPMVVTMTAAPLAIPQQVEPQRQTAQPMASSPPMAIDNMASSPEQMQSPLSDDARYGKDWGKEVISHTVMRAPFGSLREESKMCPYLFSRHFWHCNYHLGPYHGSTVVGAPPFTTNGG